MVVATLSKTLRSRIKSTHRRANGKEGRKACPSRAAAMVAQPPRPPAIHNLLLSLSLFLPSS